MPRSLISAHACNPTLIGSSAILLWSTLALLTKWSGDVPPLQLTAMAFTVAFGLGVLNWWRQGTSVRRALQHPIAVWCLGVGGLFGFHLFYFIALSHAPAVEASLIAYLWPLLIVLGAAFLPQERFRWIHLVGAIAAFLGAGLLVTQGRSLSFAPQYLTGYVAALLSALTWAGYSVLSRHFGHIPTDAVGGFCGVTALLAWLGHGILEPTVMPSGVEWAAIVGLGLGPVGLAFFTWDYGVKHGDIKLLGILSYGAPLGSTGLLVAFNLAEASWSVALACGLIVAGAAIASSDKLLR